MRSLVAGLSIGALALAGGCATAINTGGVNDRLNDAPAPEAPASRVDLDSIVAQAVADREGPRVSLRAEVTSVSVSRRLRAAFRAEDDAYVMIGHVDADGQVRIVFPTDPKDDGFVKGGRSYETNEFFAGFEDEYRFRYNTYGRFASFHPNAYDAAQGYLFIVASWRPLQFDRVSTDGVWDGFETTTADEDVKPAIQELAALVAGVNREAYTLEFAGYQRTVDSYFGGPFTSAYGVGYCNSYWNMGWSPVINRWMIPATLSGYSDFFFYRGQQYYYDSFGDCAIPFGFANSSFYSAFAGFSGFNGFTGYRPATPQQTHVISAFDNHRNPFTPRPAPKVHFAPDNGQPASTPVRVSAEYRRRGLLTPEDPSSGGNDGKSTVSLAERHARPSIQEMTQAHAANDGPTGNGGWSRVHGNGNGWGGNGGSSTGDYRARMRDASGNGGDTGAGARTQAQPQRFSQPAPSDNGMGSRPTPVRTDSPRFVPETRSAEPRTSTPPPAPAPAPAPAATSSTSGPGSSPSAARPPV